MNKKGIADKTMIIILIIITAIVLNACTSTKTQNLQGQSQPDISICE